jgi:hypothetical protein
MNLLQAYKYFEVDTPTELGARIGYTSQAVYTWRNNGVIPARAQIIIEAISGGKLKADKKAAKK